ncbi:MAG: YbaN family protein [Acidobacteriota bacterium]|nr:YbaN family protein [Acidobacteriota bacterium]
MRTTFLLLGHASIAVGFVGIFVPLLPTTPFVLLAAMCYSRGSERFHTWLHEHPRFGPMIHSWREHRAIGLRSKIVATIMVGASITWSVTRLDAPWNVVSLLIGAAVITFLLSRPTAGPHLHGGRLEDR